MQRLSSDRNFGFVIAAALALYGIKHPIALAPAALILVSALAAPRLLHGPNLLWAKFGRLLHAIMSPIVMAILFFGVFTPIAILRRALGKDSLNLHNQPGSYWIARTPPGPLTNQF